MQQQDFTTSIVVDKSAASAFNAIKAISGWWHGEINGIAEKVSDEFEYRFGNVHFSKQRVTEMIPNAKIVWEVTDSYLSSFKNPAEWTGTKLIFEIAEIGGSIQITFTHKGLVPTFACWGDCSAGWGALIQESLSSFIRTGKGVDVFS